MVKIWIIKVGSGQTSGDLAGTMPLQECRKRLEFDQTHFRSDLDKPLDLGRRIRLPAISRDPSVVVVEVDADEAAAARWKPGFYAIDLSSKEVVKRCAVADSLGSAALTLPGDRQSGKGRHAA